jgi:hypothetical protein
MTTQGEINELVRTAPNFEQAIKALLHTGYARNRGRSIMLARVVNGRAYNEWMARRNESDTPQIASGRPRARACGIGRADKLVNVAQS